MKKSNATHNYFSLVNTLDVLDRHKDKLILWAVPDKHQLDITGFGSFRKVKLTLTKDNLVCEYLDPFGTVVERQIGNDGSFESYQAQANKIYTYITGKEIK